MPSYYLWSIGCQMNDADACSLAQGLQSLGLGATNAPVEADVVILVTCVVRQSAEDQVVGRLSSLKTLKRQQPRAAILVLGCFVGDDVALRVQYPFVDAFFRPSDVTGVLSWVNEHTSPKHKETASGPAKSLVRGQARVCASVPVSYGCSHHCTYCIVRLRRGPQRSRPLAEIVADVQEQARCGAQDVTLLGQNVDAYGQDLERPAPDLADVLTAVHELPGLQRVRFLTSHPAHISGKLIATVRHLPRVCPHFELPVQSGDDDVLRRMARGYTAEEYRALVASLRQHIPHCSIATDVIVGFPGETEKQFQSTYDLLEELRLDTVHIAKYSQRPDTPAARLSDDVSPADKERRRKILDEQQARIAGEINGRFVGRRLEVLVEGRKGQRWRGRTVNNKLVFFEADENLEGQLACVEITWAGPWSLVGKLSQLPSEIRA